MKLSEAILMNGMVKPQGFGATSMFSFDAPCALGGALQSIGKQGLTMWKDHNYAILYAEWPWIRAIPATCPVCASSWISRGYEVIYHLNDAHLWSRAAIAGWVSSIEPAEETAPVTPELTCVM